MKKRRIIDKRGGYYWIDNVYLDEAASVCGWQATLVYNFLCRCADREQISWPSTTLMAKKLGVSRPTITKGLQSLEDHRLIDIQKERTSGGMWLNNTYTLLNKNEWVLTENDATIYRENDVDTVCKRDLHGLVNDVYSNKNQVTKPKNNNKQRPPVVVVSGDVSYEDITKVFEQFQLRLNPTINYGNKTQRQAAADLLKQFGLEKVLSLIEYVDSIKTQKFAPVITTPFHLREKLGQLKAYHDREANNGLTIIQ